MTGSAHKDLLDSQIAARNRWVTKNTAAFDRPRRPRRSTAAAVAPRLRSTRTEVIAAVTVVVAALLTVFVVLVLQAPPASSKPMPNTGVVSVTGGLGGGGTHPRML